MGSQTDLDQGGTFRQTQSVYLGPSIGWQSAPSTVILAITVAGTFSILVGNSLVTINVNGVVNLTLPVAKGSLAGAGAVPATFVSIPITIVDIGGFATNHPITITPAGAETIDGLASIQITSNYGAFVLRPDVVNGGWTLNQ